MYRDPSSIILYPKIHLLIRYGGQNIFSLEIKGSLAASAATLPPLLSDGAALSLPLSLRTTSTLTPSLFQPCGLGAPRAAAPQPGGLLLPFRVAAQPTQDGDELKNWK